MEVDGFGDVFGWPNTWKSERAKSVDDDFQKWPWKQDVSFYRKGLENLTVC
jgi:hypothetical protein